MKHWPIMALFAMFFLAMILFVAWTPAQAYRKLEHVAINFEGDPLWIIDANIQEIEETYGSKIKCRVTIKNEGKPISAFALGFMFYDIFNEHLSTIGGVSMDGIIKDQATGATWEFDPYRAWMAYTTIISVSRVRFSDGTIWRQNKQKMAQKIAEVTDMLFKEEQLEEERE